MSPSLSYCFGGLLFLVVVGLARELRSFGIDPSDPGKLRAGWTYYKLYATIGEVLSPTEGLVSHAHDQFFIREASGHEQVLPLNGVDIAVREGHQVSAVWGIKKGEERGPYLLFRNHSTKEDYFFDDVVKRMLKPNKWPVLALITLVAMTWYRWADMVLVQMAATQRATIEWEVVWGIFTGITVLIWIALSIIRNSVAKRRVRRFKQQLSAELLSRLTA
jgi:hypothetical protein